MYNSRDVCLREVSKRDADIMFKWINDKDLVHFNNPYRPITYESHMRWS